jgi:predicted nucleic acid-binding protein
MNPTVFLDTVGLLALWNRKDQWHIAAKQAFAPLVAGRVRMVTTSFVLLECGNAAARLPFRSMVISLRAELIQGGDLIDPSTSDCEEAWQAYDRGEAGEAGIVDHVSFAVMRRLGLTKVFSNDAHFRASGFETLF